MPSGPLFGMDSILSERYTKCLGTYVIVVRYLLIRVIDLKLSCRDINPSWQIDVNASEIR